MNQCKSVVAEKKERSRKAAILRALRDRNSEIDANGAADDDAEGDDEAPPSKRARGTTRRRAGEN